MTTIPTTNAMLRHMHEQELTAKLNKSIEESGFHKEMDEEAKKWQEKAREHDGFADEHSKKAWRKETGEAKRTHHSRMSRGHRNVAASLRCLADCCHGRDIPESHAAVAAPEAISTDQENPANR